MPPRGLARHHLSFKDLETLAKDGCEFCELLKDGILDTYTRRDPEYFKSHKDARDELFEDSCSHAGKEPKTLYLYLRPRGSIGLWPVHIEIKWRAWPNLCSIWWK